MINRSRRSILKIGAGSFLGSALTARVQDGMREVADSNIVTIAEDPEWYMHCAGIATLDRELVCTYRKSDEHTASRVMEWCARSVDSGRTWGDHRIITDSSWENDKACWIAPQ